jgi:chromosomal replication initiator protein
MTDLWGQCKEFLKDSISEVEFNQWITPLQAQHADNSLVIYAPNKFVLDNVSHNYEELLKVCLEGLELPQVPALHFRVGEVPRQEPASSGDSFARGGKRPGEIWESNLNHEFTFDTFVEGKSNQIARSASIRISEHPGTAFNPLFISGGVGLGKTHLMHAIGNRVVDIDSSKKALYIHSEKFVSDMVRSIQHNRIDDFKRKYRSVNMLLIDDIQFFAGKERSQEEFFHTFNALFETKQQIILTSDRLPKEVHGLEERLISRFGWGLTVSIDAPDLETRVAILQNKAEVMLGAHLLPEVAFFIAKRIKTNIRELEGAIRVIKAHADFSGEAITLDFTRNALKDLLAVHEKIVTVENIIKTVAEYYKIRVSDIVSKKRNRAIARPRQVAMTLAKELTDKSLSEIGEAFGGKDHTTVLYANGKVEELRKKDAKIDEDYGNLVRILST